MYKRPLCHTLLNALDMSKNTPRTSRPSPNYLYISWVIDRNWLILYNTHSNIFLFWFNKRFKVNVYSLVAYWFPPWLFYYYLHFVYIKWCSIYSKPIYYPEEINFRENYFSLEYSQNIFLTLVKKPTLQELNLANFARKTFYLSPYKRCLQW